MTDREKVIDFIKYDRTILTGRTLYANLPGSSRAMANSLNRLPESPQHVERMCYEMCKLVGIKELMMRSLLSKKVQTRPVEPEETNDQELDWDPNDLLLSLDFDTIDEKELENAAIHLSEISGYDAAVEIPDFGGGIQGNKARRDFVKEHQIESESNKTNDLDRAIEQWSTSQRGPKLEAACEKLKVAKYELAAEQMRALPKAVKESIKLRDQFPFLGESDCPDWAKILVSDLITAYHNYRKNQPLLHHATTDEQRAEILKDVKTAFIKNKKIWAELESFRDKGAPLGEHEVFKMIEHKEAIKSLDAEALSKKINALSSQKSRSKGDKKKHGFVTELLEFAQAELKRR